MSAEEKKHEEGAEESKGKGGVIPWIVVGMLSAGAGSAIPMMMSSHAAPAPEAEEKEHVEKKKKPAFELPKQEETICVPFGDGDDRSVVVNLNDGRMNRYLKISIALQIPKSMENEFPALLSSRRSELRNWCLGEIADKDLDDIRGMAGQNRLRRAIREHFNSVLFPDGYDQIYDVLFEEFYVQ